MTFEVSVSVSDCPAEESKRLRQFSIYPVGLAERLDITLDLICECDCEKTGVNNIFRKYSRLSLSRNQRDPQKQFEISVLRHIRFVVLRKNRFEQPNFTNDCNLTPLIRNIY